MKHEGRAGTDFPRVSVMGVELRIHALVFLYKLVVTKSEVLEIREEADEIQDLPTRPIGTPEGEESKIRSQVSEVLVDVRHEVRHLEVVDPKLPEVCERGKVAEIACDKPYGGELDRAIKGQEDAEPLDEGEQPQFVRSLKRARPLMLPPVVTFSVVGRGSVVKMGYRSDVP